MSNSSVLPLAAGQVRWTCADDYFKMVADPVPEELQKKARALFDEVPEIVQFVRFTNELSSICTPPPVTAAQLSVISQPDRLTVASRIYTPPVPLHCPV